MEEHAKQVAFRLGWSDTVEKDDVSIDELITTATGDASHDVFYDNALKYHTIHTVKDTADGDFFPAYLRYPRYEQMPHIAFNELIKLYPYEPLVADEHV